MARTKKEKKTRPIHPAHTHGGEIATVAGEIAGGVVGSVAGPPGAVAGMLVGAAAGALAGEVIDWEGQRTSRHDQELDDDIGVTKGDLGRGAAPRSNQP